MLTALFGEAASADDHRPGFFQSVLQGSQQGRWSRSGLQALDDFASEARAAMSTSTGRTAEARLRWSLVLVSEDDAKSGVLRVVRYDADRSFEPEQILSIQIDETPGARPETVQLSAMSFELQDVGALTRTYEVLGQRLMVRDGYGIQVDSEGTTWAFCRLKNRRLGNLYYQIASSSGRAVALKLGVGGGYVVAGRRLRTSSTVFQGQAALPPSDGGFVVYFAWNPEHTRLTLRSSARFEYVYQTDLAFGPGPVVEIKQISSKELSDADLNPYRPIVTKLRAIGTSPAAGASARRCSQFMRPLS